MPKNGNQKNISEQLLTVKALVFIPAYNNREEEEVQLHKILKACTLQPEDYAIIMGQNSWLDFRELPGVKHVLLFGISEEDLGIMIKMPLNTVISFDEKYWVRTYAIANLMSNQHAKNELWQQALKPHFTPN